MARFRILNHGTFIDIEIIDNNTEELQCLGMLVLSQINHPDSHSIFVLTHFLNISLVNHPEVPNARLICVRA